MGWFDRLFGRSAAPPPASSVPSAPAPTAPAPGRITRFDGVDGLGELTLDDGAVLRCTSPGASPRAQWESGCASGQPCSFAAYRHLLLWKLTDAGFREVATMDFSDAVAPTPPHEVHVFERPDGQFSLLTCGLGRVRQPNGVPEDDTARVELLVTVSRHHPRVASALSGLGAYLHGRGPGAPPWGPEHRLSFADPEGPSTRFALGFVGAVELGGEEKVTLLTPLPMTEAERARLSVEEIPGWIAAHGDERAVRDRWLSVIGPEA